MSAGICGKRVGLEEIFGSSPSSATKRSRCSSFGSPPRSNEFGSGAGSQDTAFTLLQMFPALDPELVKATLRNHYNRIDDAIESLHEMSFGGDIERHNQRQFECATIGDCDGISASSTATCAQMSEHDVGDVKRTIDGENTVDKSKWVDLFVQEMVKAADIVDARGRAAAILEAFERSTTAHSKASEELEHASLKEQLQSLLNDNQILKRAVSIQHERNLEQDEKTREVQTLKLVLNQYQEKIQNLEMTNYTINLHLQRAQRGSSISDILRISGVLSSHNYSPML